MKKKYHFSSGITDFYFDGDIRQLDQIIAGRKVVVVTDENLHTILSKKLKKFSVITIPAGEAFKTQSTADGIINQLIELNADRQTLLIGIGGGVVTDITGYVAAIYMRGISFGFIPSSVLAMVDAAIGGKNGIDVGVYKNMVGVIRQPEFLLYDFNILKSLPEKEWINGFAEIIKHACIKDASMFRLLEGSNLRKIARDKILLSKLIRRNAKIKIDIVVADEFESGERRLLNFGHTLAHAIETKYELAHGQAVAIGMVAACRISESLTGFRYTDRVIALIEQYGLPSAMDFDRNQVFQILKMDKKKLKSDMRYIVLDKIGRAKVQHIPVNELQQLISQL